MSWKFSGEFEVGNVGKDVGNVTFDRAVRGEVGGGFYRTGKGWGGDL